MNNSPSMYILQSQTDLNEPIENLTFIKELIHLCLPFDMITEVTYFTVFHYDNKHIQGEVALFISYNVLMIKVL